MKTQQHICTPTSWSWCFVAPPFSIFCNFSLPFNWWTSSRTYGATLYHASHTRFHISSFYVPFGYITNPFFIIFQTPSMWFISGEYPGHFRTGLCLYSMKIIVLLELLQGKRSCLKVIPSVGTKHIYMSLFFRVIAIDNIAVFGANRMNHAMWIQTSVN